MIQLLLRARSPRSNGFVSWSVAVEAKSRAKTRQCRTAPASYTVASRNRRAIEFANSYTMIILMPSNRRNTPKPIRIPRREMWCDTFVPSGARITVPTATVTTAGQ